MGVRVGNTDEFVVLSDTLGAGKRTGLDLASAEADGEMSDGDIFGLT